MTDQAEKSQPASDAVSQMQSTMRETQRQAHLDVAVIIVTYNSANQIIGCLNSVYANGGRIKKEVIVVDNGSQDETVSIIKARFPQVRLFDTGNNLGFAKACNYAAKRTQADYVLQLNPDTVVLDRAIERIVAFARKNPKYGYYGGRTLKEDGVTLERSSCWGLPTLWSLMMFATGLSTIFKHNGFFDPESLGSWRRDSIREVGVITGCFLLVERNAWHEIGGFDEHFWLYGEDADLSKRARNAGYRPVIYPNAEVIHEIGQSSTSTRKTIWLHQGKVSYIKCNWSKSASVIGVFLLKCGVLLRASVHRIKGSNDNPWVACWNRRAEWENGHYSSTQSDS